MRTTSSRMTQLRSLLGLAPDSLPGPSPRGAVGQVLPIFVFMSVVLLGGAALLTDVAWWWTNELRMRSAADAAALAGAIWLPDDPDPRRAGGED